jgi:hypothetical protein
MAETPLPYPHLMVHPQRAMTLAYTLETEEANATHGYRTVAIDTRQIVLLFTPAMRLMVVQG